MPSFDIVSKVDAHELTNAVDQANRELGLRFDFKDVKASFELKESTITVKAPSEFQVTQMSDILANKLSKRGIDVRSLEYKDILSNLSEARQEVIVRQGISSEIAKKITKLIKESNLKVQAAIQGDQVRVTGKKRDDLQETIQFLREAKTVELPLQFENFRD